VQPQLALDMIEKTLRLRDGFRAHPPLLFDDAVISEPHGEDRERQEGRESEDDEPTSKQGVATFASARMEILTRQPREN
jgi:hypothetical protein